MNNILITEYIYMILMKTATVNYSRTDCLKGDNFPEIILKKHKV